MKSHYTFSCKSDITEHDWCQVCLDFITPPFHFWGGGGRGKGEGTATRRLGQWSPKRFST